MHSVVHVNLHCRVASSHLHRPRANVERDVHFKKELDFLIYMRRLAAGVKPCLTLFAAEVLPLSLVAEHVCQAASHVIGHTSAECERYASLNDIRFPVSALAEPGSLPCPCFHCRRVPAL